MLFQITLPHGAKVEVKESFSNFVNVWVSPAAADFNNTQGNYMFIIVIAITIFMGR